MIISVNGVDGSGKSTLIDDLTFAIKASGASVVKCHLRPRIINFNLSQSDQKTTDRAPISSKKYGELLSTLKVLYFAIDYFIFFVFHKVFSRNKVIIFDRCYYDLFLFRKRFGIVNVDKYAFLFNYFKFDLNVLLIGTPYNIHERKAELSLLSIEQHQKIYMQYVLNLFLEDSLILDADCKVSENTKLVFSRLGL